MDLSDIWCMWREWVQLLFVSPIHVVSAGLRCDPTEQKWKGTSSGQICLELSPCCSRNNTITSPPALKYYWRVMYVCMCVFVYVCWAWPVPRLRLNHRLVSFTEKRGFCWRFKHGSWPQLQKAPQSSHPLTANGACHLMWPTLFINYGELRGHPTPAPQLHK